MRVSHYICIVRRGGGGSCPTMPDGIDSDTIYATSAGAVEAHAAQAGHR
jgi:hypothetical protein